MLCVTCVIFGPQHDFTLHTALGRSVIFGGDIFSGRKRRYSRTIGTVDGCRTGGGRSSNSQRTIVGGARVVSGAEKKII